MYKKEKEIEVVPATINNLYWNRPTSMWKKKFMQNLTRRGVYGRRL